MLRRQWLNILLVALPLLLLGCSQGNSTLSRWYAQNGRLKVLSTVGMIDDLVREISGDEVDRLVLIGGPLDPHSYELVKGDDEKLAGADLIFCNGLGLEHGPSLRRYLAASDRVIAVGDLIVQREPKALVQIHGENDPHIWMDVMLWSSAVPVIVEALAQRLPEKRDQFQERGASLTTRLALLDAELMALMGRIAPCRRYLVTTHDSFNYFARRYLSTPEELEREAWKERCLGPEGLSPESQLSVTDIVLVVDQLSAHNIEVIFPESNLSRDSIHKIMSSGREKGLSVRIADVPLYGDTLGGRGSDGETYEEMMRHNGRVIATYLLGEPLHD